MPAETLNVNGIDFTIIIEEEKGGGYTVTSDRAEKIASGGETMEEAREGMREALTEWRENLAAFNEGYLTEDEATWKTWFGKSGGTWLLRPERMPKGAAGPFGEYCHYTNNLHPEYPDGHPKALEAAELFEQITGYSAAEVLAFKRTLKGTTRGVVQ